MNGASSSVASLLSRWRAEPTIANNIVEWRNLPARPAQTGPFPPGLHPALVQALEHLGIQALYSHQLAAWEHSQAGQNTVIVTGPASGKSLCYHLPVLDCLLRQEETAGGAAARALYIFPTKALAQDQLATLRALSAAWIAHTATPPIPAAIYDGDTPQGNRAAIRRSGRLILTNPDMLHLGILPHHPSWADFLRNLQYIVIDEMHVYRGVFGSHVANVLRRLQRVARFYGAQPRFILTSATIANPLELAGKLIEAPIRLIEEDGSARGPRTFLIYNPPVVDPSLGLRRSSWQESLRLAEDLLAYNVQTILFGRSRRAIELMLADLRHRLPPEGENEAGADHALRGYRSGYLPSERRQIERGLRQGQVRLVAATNALELGVDIGGMEAAILVGYPGSIAATWQQAGRAGRRCSAAVSILVTAADPLDQFLAAHPDYFFGRSPEHALIDPDNLLILLAHLRCAAFELPFQDGERYGNLDSSQLREFLDYMVSEGILHHKPGTERYFWMAEQYPAQAVSLRSASVGGVQLLAGPGAGDRRVTIGQVDRASALWMVHPQAIYLHEARAYRVVELDLEQNQAILEPAETDYFTKALQETSVDLLERELEEPVPGASKGFGQIRLTTRVTGYRLVRWYTQETLGKEPLDLPATELVTTAYWLALSPQTIETLRQEGLWRNDPNDYGPNWGVQRDRARQRDGFRCQVCGCLEQGRSHDVHHKTPFRTFSSYLEANVLDNLITVCPVCHRRVEATVRVRSGLAGLGYLLGRLAPFSLMCDMRDLGIHTDPQSHFIQPVAVSQAGEPTADAGQPLVVIYDQVPAGIGLSRRLYDLHTEVLLRARQLVESCPCSEGCPSCVGPGGENGLGGKEPTLALLHRLTLIDQKPG